MINHHSFVFTSLSCKIWHFSPQWRINLENPQIWKWGRGLLSIFEVSLKILEIFMKNITLFFKDFWGFLKYPYLLQPSKNPESKAGMRTEFLKSRTKFWLIFQRVLGILRPSHKNLTFFSNVEVCILGGFVNLSLYKAKFNWDLVDIFKCILLAQGATNLPGIKVWDLK